MHSWTADRISEDLDKGLIFAKHIFQTKGLDGCHIIALHETWFC